MVSTMNSKDIPSKRELEEQYKNHTQKELAGLYNTTQRSIHRWLKQYEITNPDNRINSKKVFCTQEELYDLYVNKGLSSVGISKLFGVDKSVVLSRLREYKIARRSHGEATKLKYERDDLYGSRNPTYKNGQHIGYRYVTMYIHPRDLHLHRHGKDRRTYVHTFVMENKLGRPLASDEVIHHLDLNGHNNDISNLLLIKNQVIHNLIHTFINRTGLFALGVLSERPEKPSLAKEDIAYFGDTKIIDRLLILI